MDLLHSILILFLFSKYTLVNGDIHETRLLPIDGSAVHCAGQTNQNLSDISINSFNNYTNYLKSGTKPLAFMVYLGITLTVDQLNTWFDDFTVIMNSYPSDEWYGIQIGLWYYDINGNTFDCDIADGKYDSNINALISGFNKLGRPIWLRIGYEFNGQWTYFTKTCYIESYQRITSFLRNDTFCNKYVATVWDYTADSEYVGDYWDWYPGDDYVDWWGVNVFGCFNTPNSVPSNAGINSPYILDFISSAYNNSFPVMIGESAPRQVGGNAMPNGCAYSNSYNDWYQPYFDMINNESYNIKGFCYINWNWWYWGYNWGQGEINECPDVGPQYQSELSKDNKLYACASNEATTKALLGID